MEQQHSFKVDKRIVASKSQRFLNYLIDIAFIYLIICIVIIVVSAVEMFFGLESVSNKLESPTDFESYLIFYSFMFFYYISLEYFTNRTIAKFITGTTVVLKDGTKPRFYTICIRTLCRIIPFDFISFMGHNDTGIHDTFSKTFVVKKTIFERSYKSYKDFQEIGS